MVVNEEHIKILIYEYVTGKKRLPVRVETKDGK
jgi:hypothetical protein